MNATGRRFQYSVGMVSLVGLVDLNMVVEVRASPTDRKKKDKVPISELILRQPTTDNKPILLSVTKKYNSVGYEACYIKLYTKQGIDFGDCPGGYLVHSLPEARYELYKAFSTFAVEAAQEAFRDEEVKRLSTLQEKEDNEYNYQVAKQ